MNVTEQKASSLVESRGEALAGLPAARRPRLTMVITHPIQYHAPLYTHIAQDGRIDLHVIFHNDRGARPFHDPFLGKTVSYDNNLLKGYSHEFLTKGEPRNWREKLAQHYLGALEERILASRPDAVCLHGYNFPPYWRAVWRLRRKGVRFLMRGENDEIIPRRAWRAWVRDTALGWLFANLEGLLCIGSAARWFYERRGIPPEKLFFVPYSADNAYFGLNMSLAEHRAVRERVLGGLGVDPSWVVFTNINKHRAAKRPMDLLRAYARASQGLAGPLKACLLLIGDGPMHAEMREFVRSQNVPNVFFLGFVEQSKMRELLLAGDYCINPAEEPWGCVYNEALPAGLGIISSDRVLGWYDLVRVGVNGFVYRLGDIEALAKVLRECMTHPEWRPGFAEASRAIARVFSFESCVEGLWAALQAVARRDGLTHP